MRRFSPELDELDGQIVKELEDLGESLRSIDPKIISAINRDAKFSGSLRYEDLHTRFTL